ncbi:hypothetical protein PILCRDRAFT_1528 [Piloderma croceum F 1598]|uniref:Uncharacterized protein n=1 Tax=Piloderma croceum (strain F 1598) TaxID=765440 RepID=A0A0C3GHP7_PILCF|nr:hypothetical protein PILCRDRAFT_1528 [Piloderma croceum F 1598]
MPLSPPAHSRGNDGYGTCLAGYPVLGPEADLPLNTIILNIDARGSTFNIAGRDINQHYYVAAVFMASLLAGGIFILMGAKRSRILKRTSYITEP